MTMVIDFVHQRYVVGTTLPGSAMHAKPLRASHHRLHAVSFVIPRQHLREC
jgi:hypothetical protein